MDELIHLLERYNREYYELDEPSVSDAEYDVAFRHLQQLETQHPHLMRPVSPTQRVGGKALSQFDSVEHQVPMLSLNNAFSPVNVDGVYDHSEIQAFAERVRSGLGQDPEYFIEPKFDGLALSLVYENGVLLQAAYAWWQQPSWQWAMFTVGMLAFVASDLILSQSYFGKRPEKPWMLCGNYACYFGAQCLVAWSLAASA